MQYKIVFAEEYQYSDSNIEELEAKVQKLCDEGWKPQGGVSVVVEKFGLEVRKIAYQAMVKEN